MSNRITDSNYDQLYQSLEFFFRQRIKDVHTACPALVVEYDGLTKRAVVQPALDLLTTDGQDVARAVLADVPVVHPSGGGYLVHLPLQAGDAVMVVFSERGISQFKQTFQQQGADRGVVMSESDGIAIPGFGALSVTPAGEGVTMQTEDAAVYVEVHTDRVKVVKGQQDVEITDAGLTGSITGTVDVTSSGNMTLMAPTVNVNGNMIVSGSITGRSGLAVSGSFTNNSTNVGSSHTHGGVDSGPSRTTGPS